MKKFSPRPDFGCFSFDNCWRQFFVDRMHEVPVKLEQVYRVYQAVFSFANAFGLSHESTQSFSQYSVVVFNVNGFDVFDSGISVNYSTDFIHNFSFFTNFYKLTIVYTVGGKQFS